MYDLMTSKFDVDEHIKNYPFYTEVIIFPDGNVEYAIPSHQEKLCQVLSEMKDWTRQEVIDNTPKEYYFDWMKWLLNETGCISVWYDFILTPEEVTDAQTKTIAMLIQKKAIKISKTVQ